MSIIRQKIRDVSSHALLLMWRETEQWDATGNLPEDSLLRTFLHEHIEPTVGELSVAATWLTMVAHEVWRECAVRRLDITADLSDTFVDDEGGLWVRESIAPFECVGDELPSGQIITAADIANGYVTWRVG